MAGLLFADMPTSRSSKGADKSVIKKANNKKSAPITVKGGGILQRMAQIDALVNKKLGKYKDEYLYFMADDEEAFKDYIYNIIQLGDCSIDTETTGLDYISDTIVGLSLYSKGQKGLYIPLRHKSYISNFKIEGQLEEKFVAEQLNRLSAAGVKFKGYNAKFDKHILKNNLGVNIHFWYDAHLGAMCLNENEKHGLKLLHSKYVLDGKEDEFSFGKLFDGVTFDLVPIQTGYIYAARDAVDTDELADYQLPYLTKDNKLCKEYGLEKVSDVFWNIEMPCVDVLSEMEDVGISLDVEYAKELSKKYHKIYDEQLAEFNRILDIYKDEIEAYKIKVPDHKLADPINIASPTQLAILLYDILKVEPPDKEKPRGTGEEILKQIDNPLCNAILDFRATEKLLSTYIDKLPECLKDDGRIHCTFNQYGAKTGRMSSEEPNMQNIPSHNKDIRKMFIATPGYVMMSADFSQQEPKVMTAMCKDEKMLNAYREGKDLYAEIAALSFNTTYENCLEFRPDGTTNPDGKARRSQAKSILLGVLYGRGVPSIAEQLGTTTQKAQQIKDSVMKGFPAINDFEKGSVRMAEEVGYVTTFWGRKRRLPEMQLDEFEFSWKPGYGDVDPLSFDEEVTEIQVPMDIQRRYISKLRNTWKKKERLKIYKQAADEGIIIVDNGAKIAEATRQCVNSRIQGSAADMTKIAGAIINNNKRLKELGFRLLVPIHDEYLAECPRENAVECKQLFSECMCAAAKDLNLPISVDVEVTDRWYGTVINL